MSQNRPISSAGRRDATTRDARPARAWKHCLSGCGPPTLSSRRWEFLALALLTVAAAVVRLYRLSALSLWQDEGFSAYAAGLPLADMVRWTAADTSPPFYYALLHSWIPLCPGEFGLRLPSVLFGVMAVPLIYLCGRAAHSGRAGLIAAALLVVNPFHVAYSQEARCYALYFAASLLSLYLTLELTRLPTRARWIGWVLATAVMLYTHATAAVYVLALSGLAGVQRPDRRDRFWHAWWRAHAALAVLFLPWSFVLARQTASVVARFWLEPPTMRDVIQTGITMCVGSFGSFPHSPIAGVLSARYLHWLLLLPFLTLAVWGAARRCRPQTGLPTAGLFIYAFGPWAFLGIFSLTVRSVYVSRIFLPTLGALLLVAAILLASAHARQQALSRALAGLMFLSACFALDLHFRYYRKQEIRPAVEYVLRHAAPGDAVTCVTPSLHPATAYYLRGGNCPLLPQALSWTLAPESPLGDLQPAGEAAALRNLPSLWVLAIDQARTLSVNERAASWLDTFMRPVGERSYYSIRLTRYTPRSRIPVPSPTPAGATIAAAHARTG